MDHIRLQKGDSDPLLLGAQSVERLEKNSCQVAAELFTITVLRFGKFGKSSDFARDFYSYCKQLNNQSHLHNDLH